MFVPAFSEACAGRLADARGPDRRVTSVSALPAGAGLRRYNVDVVWGLPVATRDGDPVRRWLP